MFSETIRSLRLKNGYTQQYVADYLGIKRPTYTRYESGTNQPDFETTLKIAELYKVSTDFLLGRKQAKKIDPSPDGSIEKIMRDRPDIAKLLIDMSELSDDQVQDVYNYLKYIILPKVDKEDK